MSGVNKAFLVGHVGRDPEVKTTGSGMQVAGFSLATGRTWRDKAGQRQEKTEWHRIVAWDKQAELCAQYVKKGSQLYVDGEVTYREFEVDGLKRTVCEIRVLRLEFLGGAAKADPPSHSAAGARVERQARDHSRPVSSQPQPPPGPRSNWGGGDLGPDEIPF